MKFVFIGLIGIAAADIYIWCTFLRRRDGLWKWLHWMPLLILSAAILFGPTSMAGWFIMTALITAIFFPQGVFAMISAAGKIVGGKSAIANKISHITALSCSGIVAAMALYGLIFGWRHIVVRNIGIPFKNLPESFDGYRIAHLSDLHVGTFDEAPGTMDRIVEKVNALSPDLILFTGDIVNLTPDELKPYMRVLSSLKAPDGVYSVLGNHDYCGYMRYSTPDGQENAIKKVISLERECGMDLLLNENRIIHHGKDSIALIGVENDGLPPFPERGDLVKAQTGLPDGIFKILMSHDPTHWRRKVLPDTGIDLTLSGHTHAMQFRIGNFSPSKFIYREWGGLYSEGQRKLFVSTGTGGNIAFRWGAWPEIDVLTLRKEDQ